MLSVCRFARGAQQPEHASSSSGVTGPRLPTAQIILADRVCIPTPLVDSETGPKFP